MNQNQPLDFQSIYHVRSVPYQQEQQILEAARSPLDGVYRVEEYGVMLPSSQLTTLRLPNILCCLTARIKIHPPSAKAAKAARIPISRSQLQSPMLAGTEGVYMGSSLDTRGRGNPGANS